ncbi:tubulin domain-containing protein [Scheffersomyces coipomensis]|uniref:tubulin domain-containing protein n=1 Tax=Scheffersomyces coipomensis TaxID=1788519 RepID=UPI00315C5A6A
MPEVLNLSLSQPSNHVITHLYNNQESHLPYKKNAIVNYDNNVFLSSSRTSNGQVNYTPRALIYDFQGGLGSLSKYEYHDPIGTFDHTVSNYQLISNTNHQILPKNQYQINLDKGVSNDGDDDLLNVNNTNYWSDYNKLIYSSKSLNTLQNFKISSHTTSYGQHKNFKNLTFNNYKIGSEEFSQDLNHIDLQLDNFRYNLEKCDNFQGLNVLTQLNSGWGGFTNQFLISIIDEYFNTTTANNKHSVWIYGLHPYIDTSDSHPSKLIKTISQIKTMIELHKNCSLLFPINMDEYSPNSLLNSDEFNHQSPWHASAIPSMFINSIWGINNQASSESTSKSMSLIEDNLTRGYKNRTIVNEIKLHKVDDPANLSQINNLISNVDISEYYYGNKAIPSETLQPLDLSMPKLLPSTTKSMTKYFVKNYIIPQKHQKQLDEKLQGSTEGDGVIKNVYKSRDITDILKNDTFPHRILSSNVKSFYSEFNINTDFKQDLKSYKQLISNVKLNLTDAMDIMEDKSELIEDIDALIEEYTIDYELSDESDDDDL